MVISEACSLQHTWVPSCSSLMTSLSVHTQCQVKVVGGRSPERLLGLKSNVHVLDLRHRPELFETHDPTDSGLFVSPDRRAEQGSPGMVHPNVSGLGGRKSVAPGND